MHLRTVPLFWGVDKSWRGVILPSTCSIEARTTKRRSEMTHGPPTLATRQNRKQEFFVLDVGLADTT